MLTIGDKTALPELRRQLSDMPGPWPHAERSGEIMYMVLPQAEKLG